MTLTGVSEDSNLQPAVVLKEYNHLSKYLLTGLKTANYLFLFGIALEFTLKK